MRCRSTGKNASHDRIEICRLLVEYKADVTVKNRYCTVIALAVLLSLFRCHYIFVVVDAVTFQFDSTIHAQAFAPYPFIERLHAHPAFTSADRAHIAETMAHPAYCFASRIPNPKPFFLRSDRRTASAIAKKRQQTSVMSVTSAKSVRQ